MTPPGPPPRWARLLERCVAEADREHVRRELDELYRLHAARHGRRAADRRYRREVLAFVLAAPVEALRRRGGGGGLSGAVGDAARTVGRAVRSLVRTPGFTVVAVATLALGIGSSTLVFSVVDHVTLRPLPYPEPDRLVQVWEGMSRGEADWLTRHVEAFDGWGLHAATPGVNVEDGSGAVRVAASAVTPGTFEALGVRPAAGRLFGSDEGAGSSSDVLLTHRGWTELFGRDPGAVGRSVVMDGASRRVVGVLPAGLGFPDPEARVVLPLEMDATAPGPFWGSGGYRMVARLGPGASAGSVQAELRRLSPALSAANPVWTPAPDYRARSTVRPLREALVGGVRPLLLLLLGAVALVLLVACANVADLLLARALSRRREVAVRSALGAGRARIVGGHLLEGLLLAGVGCGVALAGALLGLEAVVALLPPEIPRAGEIRLDGRVAAAGVALALVTGVLAGLGPALRASSADPASALREGVRGGGAGRGARRLATALVVTQVAAAVVLVTGAGLLLRSLSALADVDPGFRTAGVTTARLTPAGGGYEEAPARSAFFHAAVESVRALPGVAAAAAADRVPFAGGSAGGWATFIEGVTDDPNDLPLLDRRTVSPGYFEALDIPVLDGRPFSAADGPDGALVAVVDEAAAERFWPGESPVGRRIRAPWSGAPWITVVGVVGSVADGDLAGPRGPAYYLPLAQGGAAEATLVVRAGDRAAPAGPALRPAVASVDARVPVSRIAPMERLVASSVARTRWTAGLLGLFAATTLLLGCLGVYGVVAYAVRERTRDIGVRMALGAPRERIRAAVLLDGLRIAVPGALVGLAVAVPATRTLEGLLYGVPALDPVAFLVAPALLGGAALAAVALPALRATRVDPVEVLRDG